MSKGRERKEVIIWHLLWRVCLQTYGIGGESLRGLTEKLRAVAHTLQMGIQGRWRNKSYDGRSTAKLPTEFLQAVVELITSAKGLFSMLNRSVQRGHVLYLLKLKLREWYDMELSLRLTNPPCG